MRHVQPQKQSLQTLQTKTSNKTHEVFSELLKHDGCLKTLMFLQTVDTRPATTFVCEALLPSRQSECNLCLQKCDCWSIWNICGDQSILWANEIRDRWLKERAQQCFRTQRDDVSLLTLSICNICLSNLICATSSSVWPLYPQLRLTLFPQSTELCRAAGKMEEDKGKDTERKTGDPRRQKSGRNEEYEKTKRNMSNYDKIHQETNMKKKNTKNVIKEKTWERKRENKEQVFLILDLFCGLSIFGARRDESPRRQGPNKKEDESKEWEKMKENGQMKKHQEKWKMKPGKTFRIFVVAHQWVWSPKPKQIQKKKEKQRVEKYKQWEKIKNVKENCEDNWNDRWTKCLGKFWRCDARDPKVPS